MATTNIRIDRAAHQRLKDIAEKEHSSLNQVVNELLDRYDRDEFRRAVYESFRGLREVPAEWNAYRQEMEPWDATLLDGLRDAPFEDGGNE